jgi:large subunit ribosomal protein L9
MRVVFLEDVPGVAQGGDVKEVRNGFARNYLIPKKLAVPATHNAMQRVERLRKEADTQRVRRLNDARALAELLNGQQVRIAMRVGANGRLYGSVTNVMIAEELSKLMEHEIDRRVIELAEPIRELGDFDVSMRIHPEVEATVKVLVHAVGAPPVAEAAEGESPTSDGAPAAEATPVAEGSGEDGQPAEAEADTDEEEA